jgi:tetratricopeptide (TPR) repeat protein
MKTLYRSYLVILLIATFLPFHAVAQTKSDAIAAYEAGANLIETDPEAALVQLYLALEISDSNEFYDIKEAVERLIPGTHYKLAEKFYREKKMYETLDQFEKALETAKLYFDRSTQQKVERNTPRLFLKMGGDERKDGNFEKAIHYYLKVIELKADMPEPYLGIALCYEKLENDEQMIEYLKKTLDVANQVNDRERADDAIKKANVYFLTNAQEAEKNKEYLKAIEFYTKYLEFDPNDVGAIFKIGDNNLILKEWDKAIDFFNQALAKGNGSIEPALIYYQIGVAYQGKNLKNEACQAFRNAKSGQYEANAKYQMDQMKCN